MQHTILSTVQQRGGVVFFCSSVFEQNNRAFCRGTVFNSQQFHAKSFYNSFGAIVVIIAQNQSICNPTGRVTHIDDYDFLHTLITISNARATYPESMSMRCENAK